MKKVLSVVLCVAMLVCVFAACSKNTEEETTYPTTEVITTGAAVIKESEAIDLIKSYSAKELGIAADDYKQCSFMVGGSGVQIKNDYYVKVIATIPMKHKNENGEESYTFDNKGEYYIRYDGKQILSKDMEADEDTYSELEIKK